MGNPLTENSSDMIILDMIIPETLLTQLSRNMCARLRNSEQIGMSSISRNAWWKRQRILASQVKETNLPYFAAILLKNTVSLNNGSPRLRMTVLACTMHLK